MSLCACAKAPDSIGAAAVDETRFSAASCRQLAESHAQVTAQLLEASNAQSAIRQTDTAGVLLTGIPLGSLTNDDLEPRIAALKGERDALARADRAPVFLTPGAGVSRPAGNAAGPRRRCR